MMSFFDSPRGSSQFEDDGNWLSLHSPLRSLDHSFNVSSLRLDEEPDLSLPGDGSTCVPEYVTTVTTATNNKCRSIGTNTLESPSLGSSIRLPPSRHCGLCDRPCGEGISAVSCNKCQEWFHEACAHVSEERVVSLKDFTCTRCRNGSAQHQYEDGTSINSVNLDRHSQQQSIPKDSTHMSPQSGPHIHHTQIQKDVKFQQLLREKLVLQHNQQLLQVWQQHQQLALVGEPPLSFVSVSPTSSSFSLSPSSTTVSRATQAAAVAAAVAAAAAAGVQTQIQELQYQVQLQEMQQRKENNRRNRKSGINDDAEETSPPPYSSPPSNYSFTSPSSFYVPSPQCSSFSLQPDVSSKSSLKAHPKMSVVQPQQSDYQHHQPYHLQLHQQYQQSQLSQPHFQQLYQPQLLQQVYHQKQDEHSQYHRQDQHPQYHKHQHQHQQKFNAQLTQNQQQSQHFATQTAIPEDTQQQERDSLIRISSWEDSPRLLFAPTEDSFPVPLSFSSFPQTSIIHDDTSKLTRAAGKNYQSAATYQAALGVQDLRNEQVNNIISSLMSKNDILLDNTSLAKTSHDSQSDKLESLQHSKLMKARAKDEALFPLLGQTSSYKSSRETRAVRKMDVSAIPSPLSVGLMRADATRSLATGFHNAVTKSNANTPFKTAHDPEVFVANRSHEVSAPPDLAPASRLAASQKYKQKRPKGPKTSGISLQDDKSVSMEPRSRVKSLPSMKSAKSSLLASSEMHEHQNTQDRSKPLKKQFAQDQGMRIKHPPFATNPNRSASKSLLVTRTLSEKQVIPLDVNTSSSEESESDVVNDLDSESDFEVLTPSISVVIADNEEAEADVSRPGTGAAGWSGWASIEDSGDLQLPLESTKSSPSSQATHPDALACLSITTTSPNIKNQPLPKSDSRSPPRASVPTLDLFTSSIHSSLQPAILSPLLSSRSLHPTLPSLNLSPNNSLQSITSLSLLRGPLSTLASPSRMISPLKKSSPFHLNSENSASAAFNCSLSMSCDSYSSPASPLLSSHSCSRASSMTLASASPSAKTLFSVLPSVSSPHFPSSFTAPASPFLSQHNDPFMLSPATTSLSASTQFMSPLLRPRVSGLDSDELSKSCSLNKPPAEVTSPNHSIAGPPDFALEKLPLERDLQNSSSVMTTFPTASAVDSAVNVITTLTTTNSAPITRSKAALVTQTVSYSTSSSSTVSTRIQEKSSKESDVLSRRGRSKKAPKAKKVAAKAFASNTSIQSITAAPTPPVLALAPSSKTSAVSSKSSTLTAVTTVTSTAIPTLATTATSTLTINSTLATTTTSALATTPTPSTTTLTSSAGSASTTSAVLSASATPAVSTSSAPATVNVSRTVSPLSIDTSLTSASTTSAGFSPSISNNVSVTPTIGANSAARTKHPAGRNRTSSSARSVRSTDRYRRSSPVRGRKFSHEGDNQYYERRNSRGREAGEDRPWRNRGGYRDEEEYERWHYQRRHIYGEDETMRRGMHEDDGERNFARSRSLLGERAPREIYQETREVYQEPREVYPEPLPSCPTFGTVPYSSSYPPPFVPYVVPTEVPPPPPPRPASIPISIPSPVIDHADSLVVHLQALVDTLTPLAAPEIVATPKQLIQTGTLIWAGKIHGNPKAKGFSATALYLAEVDFRTDAEHLESSFMLDLPSELQVVGRTDPAQIETFLVEIRKTQTPKKVVLLEFDTQMEHPEYVQFVNFFTERGRAAVTAAEGCRMYIIPPSNKGLSQKFIKELFGVAPPSKLWGLALVSHLPSSSPAASPVPSLLSRSSSLTLPLLSSLSSLASSQHSSLQLTNVRDENQLEKNKPRSDSLPQKDLTTSASASVKTEDKQLPSSDSVDPHANSTGGASISTSATSVPTSAAATFTSPSIYTALSATPTTSSVVTTSSVATPSASTILESSERNIRSVASTASTFTSSASNTSLSKTYDSSVFNSISSTTSVTNVLTSTSAHTAAIIASQAPNITNSGLDSITTAVCSSSSNPASTHYPSKLTFLAPISCSANSHISFRVSSASPIPSLSASFVKAKRAVSSPLSLPLTKQETAEIQSVQSISGRSGSSSQGNSSDTSSCAVSANSTIDSNESSDNISGNSSGNLSDAKTSKDASYIVSESSCSKNGDTVILEHKTEQQLGEKVSEEKELISAKKNEKSVVMNHKESEKEDETRKREEDEHWLFDTHINSPREDDEEFDLYAGLNDLPSSAPSVRLEPDEVSPLQTTELYDDIYDFRDSGSEFDALTHRPTNRPSQSQAVRTDRPLVAVLKRKAKQLKKKEKKLLKVASATALPFEVVQRRHLALVNRRMMRMQRCNGIAPELPILEQSNTFYNFQGEKLSKLSHTDRDSSESEEFLHKAENDFARPVKHFQTKPKDLHGSTKRDATSRSQSPRGHEKRSRDRDVKHRTRRSRSRSRGRRRRSKSRSRRRSKSRSRRRSKSRSRRRSKSRSRRKSRSRSRKRSRSKSRGEHTRKSRSRSRNRRKS